MQAEQRLGLQAADRPFSPCYFPIPSPCLTGQLELAQSSSRLCPSRAVSSATLSLPTVNRGRRSQAGRAEGLSIRLEGHWHCSVCMCA